jgi:acylphosphatase
MDYLRALVTIHGIVQGVFFRASTRDEAIRIGVGGWVRNLPDGTVEALFEGEKKKVEEILGWCYKGPPGAQVSEVNVFWEPYKGEFHQFDIRYGYRS